MAAVQRNGDANTGGGAISSTAQSTVFANKILVARITDPTVAHPFPPVPACANHVANLNAGSSTVFINSIAIGRIGDSADAGAMTSGSSNVFSG